MSRDVHERARELIALTGTEGLSGEHQSWLQSHLRECADCRKYEEAAGGVIRALRSQPLITDLALVRAAQRRVRSRVLERQERQERIYLVSLSCLVIGLLSALTIPLFYQAFEWMGVRAGAPSWAWEAAFAFASIVPTLLASAVLLARGTRLTNGVGKISRQEGG